MYTRWSYYPHAAHTHAVLFIPINSHDTLISTCILKYCHFLMFPIDLKSHHIVIGDDAAALSVSFNAETLPTELWHVEAERACYI